MFTSFLESKQHQKLWISEMRFLAKNDEPNPINVKTIFSDMQFLYILMRDVIYVSSFSSVKSLSRSYKILELVFLKTFHINWNRGVIISKVNNNIIWLFVEMPYY